MQYIKKYKYILLILFIIVISIFISVNLFKDKPKNNKVTQINEENILKEEPEETEVVSEEVKEIKLLYVDLKGEVHNPGVYTIEEGKRVMDVISLAGGLTNNSDTSLINLTLKVFDTMVIIVNSKEEVKVKATSSGTTPTIKNDAIITPNTSDKSNESVVEEQQQSVVNINTASIDILQTLTGIGLTKASAIIEYRNKIGGFKSIEELLEVSGIGQATFDKIKDSITI